MSERSREEKINKIKNKGKDSKDIIQQRWCLFPRVNTVTTGQCVYLNTTADDFSPQPSLLHKNPQWPKQQPELHFHIYVYIFKELLRNCLFTDLLSRKKSPLADVMTSTTTCSIPTGSLEALCPSYLLLRQRPWMPICRVWATARSFSVSPRRFSPPIPYVYTNTHIWKQLEEHSSVDTLR